VITIVRHVLDDVQDHARADAPRECCGLLVGTAERIVDSVRAANLHEGTTRFLIDPRDHVRAIRDSRARQLDVVGFYHSHPRSPAYPSETDVAESGYAGALHLIVGVGTQGPERRLFLIDGTKVTEVAFSLTDQGQGTGDKGDKGRYQRQENGEQRSATTGKRYGRDQGQEKGDGRSEITDQGQDIGDKGSETGLRRRLTNDR
jgi:proteasome lid subunit RPN8/RPN11